MSLAALSAFAGSPAVNQFPVAMDYPAALALRQMALVHDELPKYLLAPEVSALLPLCSGSAPQDAAGDTVECRRAH